MSGGPYRSRLLNLILRHSRRLQGWVDRGVRSSRFFLGWGAQLLLLPLYALARVNRRLSHPALKNADLKGNVPAIPPADSSAVATGLSLQNPSDQVLCEVLQRAIALHQPDSPQSLAPLHWGQPIRFFIRLRDAGQRTWQRFQVSLGGTAIRGVATQRVDRLLILVDERNRPIELQPDQRQQLQQRIVWELSELGQQQRLADNAVTAKSLQPALAPPIDPPSWWQRVRCWRPTRFLARRSVAPCRALPADSLPGVHPQPLADLPARFWQTFCRWSDRHAAPDRPNAALPCFPPGLPAEDRLQPTEAQSTLLAMVDPKTWLAAQPPSTSALRTPGIETEVTLVPPQDPQARGPYRSWLLNFLLRQRRRVQAWINQRLQSSRFLLGWGAQLLLLPVYAIAKVNCWFSRPELAGSSPRGLFPQWPLPDGTHSAGTSPELTPPSPMDLLDEVLEVAIALRQPNPPEYLGPLHWGQPIRFFMRLRDFWQRRWQQSQALLSGTRLRGVATRLQDRLLILVDERNRPIELLPEQRQRLQQRIVWELSQLGQQQRLSRNSATLNGHNLSQPVLSIRSPWWQRFLRWWPTLPSHFAGEGPPSASPRPSGTRPQPWLKLTGQIWQNLLHWHRRHATPALPIAALPLFPTAFAGTEVFQPSVDPQSALVAQADPQMLNRATAFSAPDAAQPSVIEAQVNATHYEQTWWQQLLGWLDRAIAWIEQMAIQLWQTFINS
jgi:hypothetical protein